MAKDREDSTLELINSAEKVLRHNAKATPSAKEPGPQGKGSIPPPPNTDALIRDAEKLVAIKRERQRAKKRPWLLGGLALAILAALAVAAALLRS